MLQKAILDHSFAGRTAFYGPSLVFSSTRSGEENLYDGCAFTHVQAAARPNRLVASLNVVESLLTDGLSLCVQSPRFLLTSRVLQGTFNDFHSTPELLHFISPRLSQYEVRNSVTSLISFIMKLLVEIKFAPPSPEDILKLEEQAQIVSRGNDWNVDGIIFPTLRSHRAYITNICSSCGGQIATPRCP
jgi:hypothetical protein